MRTDHHVATIKTALDLGLQVWRTTEARDRFIEAHDALDALASVVDERDARRCGGQAGGRAVSDQAARLAEIRAGIAWAALRVVTEERNTLRDALIDLLRYFDGDFEANQTEHYSSVTKARVALASSEAAGSAGEVSS